MQELAATVSKYLVVQLMSQASNCLGRAMSLSRCGQMLTLEGLDLRAKKPSSSSRLVGAGNGAPGFEVSAVGSLT